MQRAKNFRGGDNGTNRLSKGTAVDRRRTWPGDALRPVHLKCSNWRGTAPCIHHVQPDPGVDPVATIWYRHNPIVSRENICLLYRTRGAYVA
jgi:hypothetical protein